MIVPAQPRLASAPGDEGPPALARATPAALGLPLDRPVLVIEDEAMIAWMLESVLEEMGFRDIRLAADAAEAEQEARCAPALIVTDINLGGGPDGVEAAVAITSRTPAPVLFVSAYADAATRARIARDLPGAQLLHKPVQMTAFEGAVRALLSSARLH